MPTKDVNKEKLNLVLDKYKLNDIEKEELTSMINEIFIHEEFQKRMTDEYKHHGDITLGEHILEDTVVTYILSKKYINKNKNKNNNFNILLAVRISMLHDLYTLPWQNNNDNNSNYFLNKHGFRHPIEAAINSITWFPNLFKKEKEAEILIDGIIHHMFPLPVGSFTNNKENILELNNFDLTKNLSKKNKEILIRCSNRHKIKNISISKSIYKEGKIMSKADKKVSTKQIKNIASAKALITGNNSKI